MSYLIVFIGLFLLMLVYLRMASVYNITDKPNERSSHTHITIRGGGIIFVIAVILWCFIHGFQFPWFFTGFLIISAVSFIDDLGHVPNRLRITVHLVTVILLLFEITNSVSLPMDGAWLSGRQFFTNNTLLFIVAIPIIIGFLNAYNFMDGINGITVIYSMVTLGTFFYLNQSIHFTDPDLLLYLLAGLLIFGFFNFRKRAVCFAGDVGAVSIAFVIAFLLIMLILTTGHYQYLALVFVYGVDTVGTIVERLIKRENIFEAHRSHLYQLMANQSAIPHLSVSMIYGGIQLLINIIIIGAMTINQASPWPFITIFAILVMLFAFAKIKLYRVF